MIYILIITQPPMAGTRNNGVSACLDQCKEQQQKWKINQQTKIFKYLHNPTHLKEMLS